MGHSVGEIDRGSCGRGVVAGATRRGWWRPGQVDAGIAAGGVMIAVGAGEHQVAPLLVDRVEIAAVNAPGSVVISGERSRGGHGGSAMHYPGVSGAPVGGLTCVSLGLMEPMLERSLVSPRRAPSARPGLRWYQM